MRPVQPVAGHEPVPAPVYPTDELWDALREVSDPEMGISLVDMGMIVEARLESSTAVVLLTYTAMGCPATEMIEGDIRQRLARLPDVREVRIEVVWEPVWTKHRLTAEARDALMLLGVAI